MMLALLARCSRFFPPLGLKWAGGRMLRDAFPETEPGRYISLVLFLSTLAACAAFVVLSLAGIQLSLPMALLLFACCSAFALALPSMEHRKRSAEIEASMPFFLRCLGILLEAGVPFQRAMAAASEGEGALGDEMRHVGREAGNGMSLQAALTRLASSYESLAIKRAASQVLSAYETGAGGREIVKVGDELLSLDQHRMKEHAAKSAIFGLLFMMSSAILPTFFLVYAVAGTFAFARNVGEAEIALAMLVVFPLAGALLLVLSKATMPRTALENTAGFGAYLSWGRERAREDIERHLPDALFSVGGMPKGSGPERLLEEIAGGCHGTLSEEALKSVKQLRAGVKPDSVLDDLGTRNGSAMLRRACLMMRQMVSANSLHRLGALAEDMIRCSQMKRERAQLLAMQKYTLLAGGLLVPLILKMALGLLGSMPGIAGGESGGGLISCAARTIPIYLLLYSVMVSVAIAEAEGRRSSMPFYLAGLATAGLAVFYFINL